MDLRKTKGVFLMKLILYPFCTSKCHYIGMLSGNTTTGHRLPDYVRRLVDRIKSQNKDHQDAALLSDDESMEMSDGSILKSHRRVASPSASTELARGGSSKGCEVDQGQASTDVPATLPKKRKGFLCECLHHLSLQCLFRQLAMARMT